MKKLFALAGFVLFSFSVNACVLIHHTSDTSANEIMLPLFNSGKMIPLSEFVTLKPSEYKVLTGKSMSIKEWFCLKLLQSRLRKTMNTDGTVNLPKNNEEEGDGGQHAVWFLLGIAFFPYSLIVSLFINDDKRNDRIKWMGLGALSIFVFVLLILILFFTIHTGAH